MTKDKYSSIVYRNAQDRIKAHDHNTINPENFDHTNAAVLEAKQVRTSKSEWKKERRKNNSQNRAQKETVYKKPIVPRQQNSWRL